MNTTRGQKSLATVPLKLSYCLMSVSSFRHTVSSSNRLLFILATLSVLPRCWLVNCPALLLAVPSVLPPFGCPSVFCHSLLHPYCHSSHTFYLVPPSIMDKRSWQNLILQSLYMWVRKIQTEGYQALIVKFKSHANHARTRRLWLPLKGWCHGIGL